MALVLFILTMTLVTYLDIKYRIIPDIITIAGMLIGIIFCEGALLGILVGGGLMLLMSLMGKLMYGKASFGGGDIKLVAMIGALFGWKSALITFTIAPYLGTVQGMITQGPVAYAPYISVASIVAIFAKDL